MQAKAATPINWLVPIAAAVLLPVMAGAQSTPPPVDHGGAAVRDNTSHSALIQPPIRTNERPGSTGVIVTPPHRHHDRNLIYVHGIPYGWIDGAYTWREERVWVEGHWTERRVPPVYAVRQVRGEMRYIRVQQAYTERVYIPGRYKVRRTRVWVPGHWACLR